MKNAGRYYPLLLIAQVLLFFFVMGTSGYAPGRATEARKKKASADINGGLKTILTMFNVDCGRYPTTQEGLKILINPPADGSLTNWRGPYFDPTMVPLDPWGREYVYRFPGVHNTSGYDLYSLGPDGMSKTGGGDPDDIANWEKPPSLKSIAAETVFENVEFLPLLIPVLFVIRVIVGFVSPGFRTMAAKNRWVDWAWFAMAVLIIVVFLVMPKMC